MSQAEFATRNPKHGSRFKPNFSARLRQSEEARSDQLSRSTARVVTFESDVAGVVLQLGFEAGKLITHIDRSRGNSETTKPVLKLEIDDLEAHLDAVLGPVQIEALTPEVTAPRITRPEGSSSRNLLNLRQRGVLAAVAALTISGALLSACGPARDVIDSSHTIVHAAELANASARDWESNPQLIKNANKDGAIFNTADSDRTDLNHGFVGSLVGKAKARLAERYGITDPEEGNFKPEDEKEQQLLQIAQNQDPANGIKIDAAVEEWQRINPNVEVKTDDNGDRYFEFRDANRNLVAFNDWPREYWDAYFDGLHPFTPDLTAYSGQDDIVMQAASIDSPAEVSISGAPPLALGPNFDAGRSSSFICKDGIHSVEDAIAKAQQVACLTQTMKDKGMDVSHLTGKAGTFRELINQSEALKKKFPINTTINMYVQIQVPKTEQNPKGIGRGTIPFMFVEGKVLDLKGPVKILGLDNEGFLLTDGNISALLMKMCGNLILETTQPEVQPTATPTPTEVPATATSTAVPPTAIVTGTPTPGVKHYDIPVVGPRQEAQPVYAAPAEYVQVPVRPGFPPEQRPFASPPPEIFICFEGIPNQRVRVEALPSIAIQKGYRGPNDINLIIDYLAQSCRIPPPPPEVFVCINGVQYTRVELLRISFLARSNGYVGSEDINAMINYLNSRCISLPTGTPIPGATATPTETPTSTGIPTPSETAVSTPTGTRPPATATETPIIPTASTTATAVSPTATGTEVPPTASRTTIAIVVTPTGTATLFTPTPPSTPTIPAPQPTGAVSTATRGLEVTSTPTVPPVPTRTPPSTPTIPAPQPTGAVPTATRGMPATPTIPGR